MLAGTINFKTHAIDHTINDPWSQNIGEQVRSDDANCTFV